MDLRIQKTLDSIETEFLEMRSKMPLAKIKVNDLCANSKINKSTFYRHYVNVFDLSEKIENQILDDMISEFDQIDQLFTNPEKFIEGLFSVIQKHNEKIMILFNDRLDVLANNMEKKLKDIYLVDACSPEDDIMISFVIGGASHVFLNPKYELELYQREIAQFLRRIHDKNENPAKKGID